VAAPPSAQPLFIVGFPRSGTTMLQFLLDDHPDQAIASESHFLDLFWAPHRDLDLTDECDAADFWAEFSASRWFARLELDPDTFRAGADPRVFADFRSLFAAVLDAHAESRGKARAGEKTPDHYRHLDTVFDWFPDARVVFMVRDPRAVVASYLHVDRDWAKGLDAYELSHRWSQHIGYLNQWLDDPRVHLIRYEDLVREPAPHLRAILTFAGLRDETAAILSREQTASRPTGSLRSDTAVSDRNVEAWRSRLGARDLAVVEAVNRRHMHALGYQPVGARLVGALTLRREGFRRRRARPS
jgi:hypothetical protein